MTHLSPSLLTLCPCCGRSRAVIEMALDEAVRRILKRRRHRGSFARTVVGLPPERQGWAVKAATRFRRQLCAEFARILKGRGS